MSQIEKQYHHVFHIPYLVLCLCSTTFRSIISAIPDLGGFYRSVSISRSNPPKSRTVELKIIYTNLKSRAIVGLPWPIHILVKACNACLYRILAIPAKLLHISLTNPKISRLNREITKKYKNRHRISESDAGSIISFFFCVVSFANVNDIGLFKVYQYSRGTHITFALSPASSKR